MVQQSVVLNNSERIQKLGEINFTQDIEIEELQAIKELLMKGGLIVDVKEQSLIILSIKRKENKNGEGSD